MYTQRFQRHNKNEFLCLFVDVLALMMSLPIWGAILTKRWKGTPLRECVLFAPSGMKIHRQVWPRWVPVKKYMNKVFKIHPLAEKPPSMDFHQIWHSHRVIDLITCDKYFGDRLRGVDYVAVIFCHFLLISPTQPVISDLSGGKFFFQNRACVYISCWFAVFHIHRNCTFWLSLHNSAPSQHATCTILKITF